MKKLLLFAALLLVESASFVASASLKGSDVNLQVGIVEPSTSQGGHPRTPIVVPSVTQDGHTLYFNNVTYDLELVLVDEDGDEVYSVLVPANTASVVLPSSLSGDYELQLYPGEAYYFYCVITL